MVIGYPPNPNVYKNKNGIYYQWQLVGYVETLKYNKTIVILGGW